MKTVKLGTIFVVSVMALAAIGGAYALWYQDLTIEAEIHTGNFCVGVRDVGVGDPGPDPNHLPGINDEGKDVAQTISTNIGDVKCTKMVMPGQPPLVGIVPFFHSIKEEVVNAYPWYASGISIAFANCGTIPAKIKDGHLIVFNDDDHIMDFLVLDDVTATDLDTATGTTVDVTIPQDLEGFQHQLHPCHILTITINFYFQEDHPDGSGRIMPQGANADFTYFIQWAQWNEVP